MVTRREFWAGAAALAAAGCVRCRETRVGECWRNAWRPGHFQVHMIYTGTAESLLLVFPDSTSMLLDCGDTNPHTFNVKRFGPKELPILPSESRRSGEWIARYVERMNPRGRRVDYMMLSHFHGDHSGSLLPEAARRDDILPNGEQYCLSGFALAAETLRFSRAIDRGWPNYDDPLPYPPRRDWMGGSLTVMRQVYRHLAARDGLVVEKFRVGETDQIRMLHDAAAHPGFSVFNLCGCGKVAMKDGTVCDVYAGEHAKHRECIYNENAMSLGNVFTYGRFRFYTAGDFTASDRRKGIWHGQTMDIERILAKACKPVSVAKANHHAGWACPDELVAALRPRVWLAPVWWRLHGDKKTMNRLASRTSYAGDRLLLPGVMAAERRAEDAGEPYLADVPAAVHTPSHVVVDVPPGGETFSVFCLDAADEDWRIKAHWNFSSVA